jgi:hypothetical protein
MIAERACHWQAFNYKNAARAVDLMSLLMLKNNAFAQTLTQLTTKLHLDKPK